MKIKIKTNEIRDIITQYPATIPYNVQPTTDTGIKYKIQPKLKNLRQDPDGPGGWSGRLIFLGHRNHLPHFSAPRYVSTKMALFILSYTARSRRRTLLFITYLITHSRQKYKRSNSFIGPLRQAPEFQSILRNPKQ